MNTLLQLVADAAELPENAINPESAFVDIRGWDSLALMRLVTSVEDVYQIEMTGEDVQSIKTVQELTRYLEAKGKLK